MHGIEKRVASTVLVHEDSESLCSGFCVHYDMNENKIPMCKLFGIKLEKIEFKGKKYVLRCRECFDGEV